MNPWCRVPWSSCGRRPGRGRSGVVVRLGLRHRRSPGLDRRTCPRPAHGQCLTGAGPATGRGRAAGPAVAWDGRGLDEPVDLALVVVTDPGWLAPRRPVRWGRLVTTVPRMPCEAWGFPNVLASPQVREVEQASGSINPGGLRKSGRLAIGVDDPPARVVRDSSPWAGMSGAAVWCHGLVTAVVVVDPAGFDSRRLVAVPVHRSAGAPVGANAVGRARMRPVGGAGGVRPAGGTGECGGLTGGVAARGRRIDPVSGAPGAGRAARLVHHAAAGVGPARDRPGRAGQDWRGPPPGRGTDQFRVGVCRGRRDCRPVLAGGARPAHCAHIGGGRLRRRPTRPAGRAG